MCTKYVDSRVMNVHYIAQCTLQQYQTIRHKARVLTPTEVKHSPRLNHFPFDYIP